MTVQSKPKTASVVAVSEDTGELYPAKKPLEVPEDAKFDIGISDRVLEQKPESQSATVQVIKGSSIHDIGDIEEQQSAEDVFELQPVVVDGGRLTESSRTQAGERLESSDGLDLDQGSRPEDVIHPLPATFPKEIETVSQLVKPLSSVSRYVFPDTSNFERLNRLADELPDFVHIPLHMAVSDEVLEGWEEDWFARAEYDATKHGRVGEPKIDFVYTCKFFLAQVTFCSQADCQRGQWFRHKVRTHHATLRTKLELK